MKKIKLNLTIVEGTPDNGVRIFVDVDGLLFELSLSLDETIRRVFESNTSSNPTSSLSEKTRRRILSRLKSGGIHCLLKNKSNQILSLFIDSLTYGRSSGVKGDADEDDVVPVEALFFDDDCRFFPKTRFKIEFIFFEDF